MGSAWQRHSEVQRAVMVSTAVLWDRAQFITVTGNTASKGCLRNRAVKAKINNSAWKANLKQCLINYL